MVNRGRMQDQLILHEGIELVPYLDTEGNLTVGVGYNVHARGWDDWIRVTGYQPDAHDPATREGCLAVLSEDIDRYEKAVRVHWPYYNQLDEVRQRVALDFAFNMGFEALTFKKTIAAMEQRDWSKAAMEMHKSKAQGQEPNRINRLAQMTLTGQDWTS